jgi:L-threonylcarbamoyladenylate synthase
VTALIDHAVALLRAGALVAFPTETVYGLGADAQNQSAVLKIFAVKGRPSHNPLIVHLAEVNQIPRYCDLQSDLGGAINPELLRARLYKIATLWPGPLSVVLPRGSGIAPAVSGGGSTIALRIPNHPLAQELLRRFDGPIAAPSANLSQYISPTTAEHVRTGLGTAVGLILDGGPCTVGLESTVLSLISPTPQVLRAGAITREQIEQVLGETVTAPKVQYTPTGSSPQGDNQGAPHLSPGLLKKHYAPHTPVQLLSELRSGAPLPARVGVILFAPRELPFQPTVQRILSPHGDLAEVATQLFAALRELDTQQLDLIIADTCTPEGLGAAIMDRLHRAAATLDTDP